MTEDHSDCPACQRGYSPQAQLLEDQWYGRAPFDPASTGSTPLTPDSPPVRALAERNVANASAHYGLGEQAIRCEAARLAQLWNGEWSHHLAQADVDALVESGQLRPFTHTCAPGEGWKNVSPPVTPTAAEVNEWSLSGTGHDAVTAAVVIRARCAREGIPELCSTCGQGSVPVSHAATAQAGTVF
jgi:hypothetical protein